MAVNRDSYDVDSARTVPKASLVIVVAVDCCKFHGYTASFFKYLVSGKRIILNFAS